jgi:hypothetical protein
MTELDDTPLNQQERQDIRIVLIPFSVTGIVRAHPRARLVTAGARSVGLSVAPRISAV